jgi:hypothetical protein
LFKDTEEPEGIKAFRKLVSDNTSTVKNEKGETVELVETCGKSTIADEKRWNVFMMLNDKTIQYVFRPSGLPNVSTDATPTK